MVVGREFVGLMPAAAGRSDCGLVVGAKVLVDAPAVADVSAFAAGTKGVEICGVGVTAGFGNVGDGTVPDGVFGNGTFGNGTFGVGAVGFRAIGALDLVGDGTPEVGVGNGGDGA